MKKISRYNLKKILIFCLLLLELIIISNYLYTKSNIADPQIPPRNEKLLIKNKRIWKRRKTIKHNLNVYLKTITRDKTVSVSFYNLGSKNKNSLLNNKYDNIYQAGSLQTEANAHTPEISASTYKLFIAAYLMEKKNEGNFAWTNTTNDGFYRMIVNSENGFAEHELSRYSLFSVNQFIQQQNWYSPVFSKNKASQTTSYSLQLLLEDLNAGQGPFTNQTDRQKLLNLMSEQKFRTGIPAGVRQVSPEAQVADKVGFLNDTNNDAAIVTLPNGQQYILVILTHGHGQSGFSGFPKIAEIAKRVQLIVYGKE